MPDIKTTKAETLSTVDAIIALIDKYPRLQDNDSDLSSNRSSDAFQFMVDLLLRFMGLDDIIKLLSKVITVATVPLEGAVKTVLLTNIKGLFSCSINPFITETMLRDGFVFDVRQTDLLGILRHSPINRYTIGTNCGQYYYFGCEDCKSVGDTLNVKDFNAVLWHTIQRPNTRVTWRGSERQTQGQTLSDGHARMKSDGIVTVEYTERGTSMTDATGSAMDMQVPYGDVVHVFIGDARRMDDPTAGLEDDSRYERVITAIYTLLGACGKAIDTLQGVIDATSAVTNATAGGLAVNASIRQDIANISRLITAVKTGSVSYNSVSDIVTDNGNGTFTLPIYSVTGMDITFSSVILTTSLASLQTALLGARQDLHDAITASSPSYRPLSYNYYYGKTLLEFNTDFVSTMCIFDPKVVALQTLQALFGCLDIEANMTMSEKLVKSEVDKMVRDIIETDDAVVSDCFFSFSNEQYNEMLERAELTRMGAYVPPYGNPNGAYVDAQTITDALNTIADDATLEEQATVIEGVLRDSYNVMSSELYGYENETKVQFQAAFLKNLLSSMAYVITSCLISPKLYILLIINMKVIGEESQMNLSGFISRYRVLLKDMIRTVRDQMLDYVKEELMRYVKDIMSQFTARLAIEQSTYYTRLLARGRVALTNLGRTTDWDMARPGADIYSDESGEEDTTIC